MVATDLPRRDLLKVAGAAMLAAAAPLSLARAQADTKSVLAAGARFTMGEWGGEPIEWRVLNVSENSALVISEYGLDCKPFNSSTSRGNSWYSSDLCNWLNNEFLAGAFSEDERYSIREVTCLSVDEAERYFEDDDDRICKPTPYAVQQGAYVDDSTGGCGWWLRSPGCDSSYAARVNFDGDVDSFGWIVVDTLDAARPALILNR